MTVNCFISKNISVIQSFLPAEKNRIFLRVKIRFFFEMIYFKECKKLNVNKAISTRVHCFLHFS